jgi:hypothetical protein
LSIFAIAIIILGQRRMSKCSEILHTSVGSRLTSMKHWCRKIISSPVMSKTFGGGVPLIYNVYTMYMSCCIHWLNCYTFFSVESLCYYFDFNEMMHWYIHKSLLSITGIIVWIIQVLNVIKFSNYNKGTPNKVFFYRIFFFCI